MEAWTDERLDDLAASLRPLPAEVARLSERIDGLTERVDRLAEEMCLMRMEFAASQRQLAQIGWGLSFALVAALIALMVSAL